MAYEPNVHATGDPHLINVYGQHFDIFKPGVHELLQVPRGAGPMATRLHLEARAQQLGSVCDELYFTALNLTGKWVEDELYSQALNWTADFLDGKPAGGLRFSSESAGVLRHAPQTPWMYFGGVGVKVAWGRTGGGIRYLNVLLKHVSQAGYPVGGLLGGDDHTVASTRSQTCSRALALRAFQQEDPQGAQPVSPVNGAHMAVADW